MKKSARAKRLAKHHKRVSSTSKLNLVSLMDIFTILVFFLIVNQSEVRVLQNTKEISLPVSTADELPEENLIITVLNNTVLVQERPVWRKEESLISLDKENSEALSLALKTELDYQSAKRPELTSSELEKGRSVTIIGDSSIPYVVLKQIMAACAETDYRNMSLAVELMANNDKGE